MIPFVGGWLLSKGIGKFGQYAIIGGVLLLAVGAMGWRIYAAGRDAGELKAAERITEDFEKKRALDRAEAEKKITAASEMLAAAIEREEQYRKQVTEMAAIVDRANARLASIQERRVQEHARIDSLQDNQLFPFITRQIGVRRPEDPHGTFYPDEMRWLARCSTDWPLCQKQAEALSEKVEALDGKVEGLEGQVSAVKEQVKATEMKFAAAMDYATALEGHYVALYNAFPRKRRSAKCLFLWKCGRKKIDQPAPIEVRALRPVVND